MPNEKPPRGFAALRADTAILLLLLIATNVYWFILTGQMKAAIAVMESRNDRMKQDFRDLARGQIDMLDGFARQAAIARSNGDWMNWSIRSATIAEAAKANPDSAEISAMFNSLFEDAANDTP